MGTVSIRQLIPEGVPGMTATAHHHGIVLVFTLLLWVGGGVTRAAGTGELERRHAIEEMYHTYRSTAFPRVEEISVRALAKADQNEFIVVDVRERREVSVSRIPGAITRREFEKRYRNGVDRTVVVYCTIGYRSGVYAARLGKNGLRAANLVGGVLLWAHEGHAFEGPLGPTHRVHVYGSTWDLLPDDYESVY